ncbi:Uu.00g125810.m01.CDS01 [Anthostomella pinea]|uniref:Protein BFR2 n=1 Tax=Anthostomella pinea TaxID=933095 RepID=A0AAI8VHV8_9PEZI|nr:Uu.00g125810.m01.CDS01 [Anthostomella pinea]
MGKAKGHARQFAELEDRPVQDYDPEADAPVEEDASGSEELSVDEDAGTEHYVNVGKSKLRRKDQISLGPQYRGARVSRADLEEDGSGDEDEEEAGSDGEASSNYEDAREDFDDPDTADLEADQEGQEDAEIDSDEAFNESDEERFKDFVFRSSSQATPKKGKGKRVTWPTAADYMGSSSEDDAAGSDLDDDEEGSDEEMLEGEESFGDEEFGGLIDDEAEVSGEDDEDDDEEEEDDDEDDEEDEELDAASDEESQDDDDDESQEDESDSDAEEPTGVDGASIRKSMGEMLTSGQQRVTGALTQGLQKDIAKGQAVRQQRKTFDALLHIRIRMQKSLVAVNSLNSIEQTEEEQAPYEAAEAAAVKLWNAIDNFRSNLQPETAKAGQKRKRHADVDTPSQDMWNNMEAVEGRAIGRRRAVLEKWSGTTKNIKLEQSDRKFVKSSEKPITVRLDEELDAPERLVKRTRTPRSCAPVQVAKKVNEDPEIFDDADFYQLLLKELVDQRTSETSGAGMQAATIRYAAVKEAKAKRHVDTKASKGRKMRFTVHEKLQNFMAPEDRRTWEQSAIDRFFGTLFGQKMALNEDGDSDEEMGGVSVEEEGLRLFRN